MPRVHAAQGVAVKTRLTTAAHAQRIAMSGVLVLVVALIVSGATLGSATDSEPIDAATQAAWLEQHFRCEHHAEMAEA
jgi:hypothetical protein